MPPWTPLCCSHHVSLKSAFVRLQLWHPVHLFMISHVHTGDVHFSQSQAQSSPFLQSTKQNTELPIHKHPQEEEPHVADATALLNASFKAFWGLMSNLAKILSRDHTVWIRALWRSLAGLKARKLCKNQSLPSAFSSTMKMRAEIGCVMLNLPAFSLCIKHAADLLERRGWQNADC